jgi:hypothetical protein
MFSRVLGFVVRLFVLLAAAICIAGAVIATVVELVCWPLVPLLVPVFLLMAVLA